MYDKGVLYIGALVELCQRTKILFNGNHTVSDNGGEVDASGSFTAAYEIKYE